MQRNAPDEFRYGSVCSGIEAVAVAWRALGLSPAWLSEIDPFANAVLAHHYGDIPNLGDMTQIAAAVRARTVAAPDILVGGTPCQAFSIAGLRQGLSDVRGALTLKYVELANAIDEVRSEEDRPSTIVIWENVPGVLSDRANAFGCFLAALSGTERELHPAGPRWTDAGCVHGPQRAVAWRVLDAQHFGLAQRRKRVFVVASARDDLNPGEILFESQSVRRDHPPSRETLEDFARGARGGAADASGDRHAPFSHHTLTLCFGGGNTSGPIDPAACLTARGHKCDFEIETFAAQAMAGSLTPPLTCAHGVTEDGNGRGTPIIAQSGGPASHICDACAVSGSLSHTLNTANGGKGCSEDGTGRGTPIVAVRYRVDDLPRSPSSTTSDALAFAENSRGEVRLEGGDGQQVGALSAGGGKPGQGFPVVASVSFRGRLHGMAAELSANLAGGVHASGEASDDTRTLATEWGAHLRLTPDECGNVVWRVRRLMPIECERLQGFPDNYTLVPWRGALAADGPRYKAIGNSMAVPCITWIGRRLKRVLERAR